MERADGDVRGPRDITPSAFLARVGGETWLFAKGPGKGVITLRALLPAPVSAAETTLQLGRFDAPCRLAMTLAPGIHLTSATLPIQNDASTNAATGAASHLTLWPAQGRPGWLRLRRQAPVEGPGTLRAILDRTIAARGAALEVTDDVTLQERLRAGQPLRLGLPAGLRLLRAEAVSADGRKSQATIETTGDALTLTPQASLDQVSFHAVFAAELQKGQARPGGWSVPGAVAQYATLILQSSPDYAPVAPEPPPALRPIGGSARQRQYACDGPLPDVAIDLVPLKPPLPPAVSASLRLERGEATAAFTIDVTNTHRSDLLFHTPAGWVVTDLALSGAEAAPAALPAKIQQLDSERWTVAWNERQPPRQIALKLHRAGAWGAPGTTATLTLPLLGFEGPRSTDYTLRVDWPEAFDVRPAALSGLEPAPAPSAATAAATTLYLRANGDHPAGTLEVRGRSADLRATVVTALTVGEDQARVRALITYQVANAPASTFRFRLPAGTGQGVKISGAGIRESTLRATPQGDEWTVVTQSGILGDFPLTLEWPLAARPGRAPVEAPQIRLLGITAQQGFIVLESSETLQLTADARNLAETDQAEVPPVPWPRDSRILGAWRYIEPAYTLRVTAEKFQPAPSLAGLVREAALTTTIAPEGARLTRANYTLLPLSDRQFFGLRLPGKAQLWSVLVDGEGVKPARRLDGKGGQLLLVPLPATNGHAKGFKITILYREDDAPLTRATRLDLNAPALSDPVNKTTWNLNLPPGFEYLTYGGSMVNTTTVREPLARFMRTAYYPSRLVAPENVPTAAIVIITVILSAFILFLRYLVRHRKSAPTSAADQELAAAMGMGGEPSPPSIPQASEEDQPLLPPPAPEKPRKEPPRGGAGCGSTFVLLLLAIAIILVLAAIAVPNFLEAQVRSKVARAKGDMRTLAVAMESYAVDNNTYPADPNVIWQGPVKYTSSWFTDPYAPTPNTPLRYLAGVNAVRAAKAAGYLDPNAPDNIPSFYMLYSIGPDQIDNGGMICYDPSNGTASVGDIIRIKDGGAPSFPQRTFSEVREKEGKAEAAFGGFKVAPETAAPNAAPVLGAVPATAPAVAPAAPLVQWTYDPSNGTTSAGDVYRYKGDASDRGALGKRMFGVGGGESASQPQEKVAEEERLRRQRAIIESRVELRVRRAPATSATQAAAPAIVAAQTEELVPLEIKGGKPMFIGTPRDVNSPNLERDEDRSAGDRVTTMQEKSPEQQKYILDQLAANRNLSEADKKRIAESRQMINPLSEKQATAYLADQDAQAKAPARAAGKKAKGTERDITLYDDSFDLAKVDGDRRAGARGGQGGSARGFEGTTFSAPDDGVRAQNYIFGMSPNAALPSGVTSPAGLNASAVAAGPAGAIRRQAGLLSLNIEIPEGGVQRSFETLGGEASIDIRLLEQDRFLRWHFVVWIAAFLALSLIWLASPRTWRIAFLATFSITLLVPILVRTPWVVFFNTAFQGTLFSLAVPLLGWLLERIHTRLTTAVFFFALGLALAGASTNVRAQAAPAASAATIAPEPLPDAFTSTKLLVPYDPPRQPWTDGDPLAFISRAEFTRLWNAAHPERVELPGAAAALTELTLEGAFVPEASALRGTLTLRAVNPAAAPAALPLRMKGLLLEGAACDPPGAAIETATSSGLMLRLAPGWSGVVRSAFTLHCESQGSAGHLALEFPEAAAGLWRFTFPWSPVTPQGPGAAGCIAEAVPQGMALTGPARPGPLDLGWTAGAAGEAAAAAKTSSAAPASWRCEIENNVPWVTLFGAAWYCTLKLEGIGGSLPAEVRLPLDPGVRVISATGEALRATTVTGGELRLRLAPARQAAIKLSGIIPPPASGNTWSAPGLHAPAGMQSRVTVRLDVANDLEILSVTPAGLERRAEVAARAGFASRQFEASAPDWHLAVELARPAPSFSATVREFFMPGAGTLRQSAIIGLIPRDRALGQLRMALPPGARVLALSGRGLASWVQDRQAVLLTFDPPLQSATTLSLAARTDDATSNGLLALAPLGVEGASQVRHTATILVPPDAELQEAEMSGATPRVPDDSDNALLAILVKQTGDPVQAAQAQPGSPAPWLVRSLLGEDADPQTVLRSWALASDAPLRLRLAPLRATALARVFNRVTLGEGIQTLDAVLSADPRRGRLREVTALLRLPAPDPAAASRLQATEHVRHVRTEILDPATLRVTVELDAPQDKPFRVRFHYDQPAPTDSSATLRAAVLLPVNANGARAFLLLRRQIEGELTSASLAGARAIDPTEIAWPGEDFRPQPSDRAFELPVKTPAGPSFRVQRHTRDEALRAFVDILRHRSIVSADGQERNELEIVLQNQSLQFLKVALPYARRQVTLYETQVAGRVVRATAGEAPGGKETILMIPLIRTGLLDPELTVRVAYVVQGQPALARRGERRHRMPAVLEGIPVGQSTMVLMLPAEFQYSGFRGSMNRVELVDLEVDEALRTSKRIEKYSESVLYTRGTTQQLALGRLNTLQEEATNKLKIARQTTEAFGRNYYSNQAAQPVDKDEAARQQKLAGERTTNLGLAEASVSNALSNAGQAEWFLKRELARLPGQPAAPAPQPAPTPAATPQPAARGWVEFPRAGDVFAFRQLQGTGEVAFEYVARRTSERRNDILLALGLIALAALLVFQGRRLFATRGRILAVAVVLCLAGIASGTALDLAIPGLALALLMAVIFRKKPVEKTSEGAGEGTGV